MAREFNPNDEGKTVRTADGDTVGTIEKIQSGVAHVRPKDSLSRSIRRRLGWAEEEGNTFELARDQVMNVTDDEVRLNR